MQSKGEHGTCPTVKVVSENQNGFKLINESDFDPKKHTLYEEVEGSKTSEADGFSDMSVAELKAYLEERGSEVPQRAKKDDLIAACRALPA